jgi:hypothetical protein
LAVIGERVKYAFFVLSKRKGRFLIMAKLIQIPYEYNVSIPISTAQAVQQNNENPISLEALGLLVNLLSYPTTWELHKTELYKRFAKNKESSVRSAWNDLMAANYIIEFKYRNGKKWEYVYYFRKVPFSPEEKAEILENARNEYGEIWGLDFQDLKMKTSKPRGNQNNESNTDIYKTSNNHYVDNIDDDKRTSPAGEGSAKHNDESINLIISNLREATKDELSERSFKSVVRKVVDKYNQGKVSSFRDYLVTALIRKIDELEFRRQKNEAKQQINISKKKQIETRIKNWEISEKVPFYNWLEE